MKHLEDAEFIELMDGTLDAARAKHLSACAACRARHEALHEILERVGESTAPEPSPLYWDHLSARIAEAVRAERAATASTGRMPWLRSPAAWGACSLVVVAVLVATFWRVAQPSQPAPAQARATIADVGASEAPPAPIDVSMDDVDVDVDMDQDEAWGLVRTVAEGVAWEDAHAAGIMALPGSAERVALELNADERAELARLLRSAGNDTGA